MCHSSADKKTLVKSTMIAPPSLIYVYVDWCPFCQKAKPIIDQVERLLGREIPVVRVNAETQKALAKKLGASSYPTILYLDRTGSTHTFEGERSVDTILNFVCNNASKAHGPLQACRL
jgi:thiol-disulfide isomerase/thioredoxin